MMTVDELAVVLFELAQTPDREEWIAEWQSDLLDNLVTLSRWASGKFPADVTRKLPRGHSLQELSDAALLFIKRTCFAEEGNYYRLFGLAPERVTADLLRTRYRALIRLTHPDVGVQGLPEDAAGLVNRAYAVLGDERARRAYDQQLTEQEPGARAPMDGAGAADFFTEPAAQEDAVRWHARQRVSGVHRTSMSDRMWARWVMVNARWSRQLQVLLGAIAIAVPLLLFFVWSLSAMQDADTIVALAPDADGAAEPVRRNVSLASTVTPDRMSYAREHGQAGADADSGQPQRLLADDSGTQEPGERSGLFVQATLDDQYAAQNGALEPSVTGLSEGFLDSAGMSAPGSPMDAVVLGDHSQPDTLLQGKRAVTVDARGLVLDAPQDWPVDWPAARRYLQAIAVAVEDQSEIRLLNRKLERTDVEGSLLAPVVALYEHYGSLSAHYSTWAMAEGRGLFDAETTLTVQAREASGEQAERFFLLRARFEASEHGTRLTMLDLMPAE